MKPSSILDSQGRRLLQIAVILLLVTSFWGFFFPYLASPPLGLSAHKLLALLAALFLGLGLGWPRLALGAWAVRTAFWLLLYSSFAIVAAYVLGAIWGAGNETMRLAAGSAHGTAGEEMIIRIVAYSSGPTGIISFALILWGLRHEPTKGSLSDHAGAAVLGAQDRQCLEQSAEIAAVKRQERSS